MYIHVTCKMRSLWRAVGLHVLMPFHDGYPDAAAPYPTLYLLPGYSANASELVYGLPLRQLSAKYGVAVVIPDGENSFYVDQADRGAYYSRFVGEELVSVTRSLFPALATDREHTFLGGISMGGYGAVINALKWNEVFSRVVMLSPALDIPELYRGAPDEFTAKQFAFLFGDEQVWREGWLNPEWAITDALERGAPIPRMLMCCGELDTLVVDGCRALERFAHTRGAPLATVYGKGGHEMDFWDGMLDPCFRFITAP